jgi:zinc/manganese transport system permease protein
MLLSVVIALVTVWAAIAISYRSNWPVGFFVGTFGAVSYGLGRAGAALRRRLADQRSPALAAATS